MRPSDDATTPDRHKPTAGYRPHLDGIRAIAVVAVILFHLGYEWIPGGFVGVDVFFVLSGYLITGILLEELARRSTTDLRRFYARRVRRLLPASILVLVAVGAAGLVTLDLVQQRSLGWDVTFAALYSANWRFAFVGGDYFAPGDVPSPLVHYWSLAVEEQFYLLWPAVLLLLHRMVRRLDEPRRLGLIASAIAVLTAASLAASLVFTGRPSGYYGTHTRAYQLLAGALLATLLRWRPPGLRSSTKAKAVAAYSALFALGTLAYFAHSIPDATDYPGVAAVAVTAASLVLVAAVDLVPSGPAARTLGVAPAAAVGRLSYSLYIWHWPIIVLAPELLGWKVLSGRRQSLGLVALTVLVSLASYLLFEKPIRFRLRPSAPQLRVVSLGLGLSVLVATISYPVFQPRSEFSRRALDAVNDIAPSPPCPYAATAWPRRAADAEPCIAVKGRPGAPVIALVGDSHAQALTPAIDTLARRSGATVVRAVRRACTPVDVLPTVKGETNQSIQLRDCMEWRRAIFPKVIREFDPDVVVVANRDNVRDFTVDGTKYAVGDPSHLDHWAAGWDWTLDTLTAGSGTVVVTTILPTIRWRVPACLAEAGKDAGCDMPVSADKSVEPFNAVIRSFDGTHDGDVKIVDLTPVPCPGGTCQAMIDDVVVFRDDNHLSATFAREHASDVAAVFARAGIVL